MMMRYLILLMTLAMTLTIYSSGAEPDKTTGATVTKESPSVADVTITKEWDQVPLREVLRFIADKANITIIPDVDIDDSVKVTHLAVNNLNWRDVLSEAVRLGGCLLEEAKPNYFRVENPPRITLDMLEDTAIEKVIPEIASMAGVSIIISSDVKGTVKFSFKDVPWMDALDYICKTTGFTMVKESHNVYRIIQPERLAAQMETRIFQLKYLRPPTDYRAKIDSTYAVGTAKPPDSTKDFTLLEILQNILSKGGMLKYDAKTNCLIVKDTKPTLDEIQKIIEQLDIEPLQIMFMVNFVNTTNDDLLKFGIDYTSTGETDGWAITSVPRMSGSSAPSTTERITNSPFGVGGVPSSGTTPRFAMGFLSKFDLTATLRLFAKDVNSKLEQRPFLLTLDGKEATVWVGEEIHFAQVTVGAVQGSSNTQTQIAESGNSPARQGFQLLVIPNIVKGTNKIMLTIIPQNSLLTGAKTTTPEGFDTFSIMVNGLINSIDLPRIQTTALVTHLIIEDGQTAVIGGLSTERVSKTITKIPVLGDIPIIGETLFRYTNDSMKKTHLLIYLTTRIIRQAGETKEVLKSGMEAFQKESAKETESEKKPAK